MYSPDKPDEVHLHPNDIRAFPVDYSQALAQMSEEAGETLVISESTWIYQASQLHKGDGVTEFSDGVVYPTDSKTDTTTVAWFWAKSGTKSAEVVNKIRLNNKELSNKRIKIIYDR